MCRDYITEKFWKVLDYNTIPVVFNGVNMTALAPRNSYIDIKDFENIKGIPSPKSIQIIYVFIIFLDAAMFLLKVSEDKEAYSSFFWWRQFYTFTQGNSKVSISTLIPLLHLTMLLIANRARESQLSRRLVCSL